MTRLLAVLALALWAPAASAQHMDKALFLAIATGGDAQQQALLLVYLRGVLNGLEAANMVLLRRSDARLFCAPPDRPLDPEWLEDALLDYLRRYPDIPDSMSIALIAALALDETFPCPTGARAAGPPPEALPSRLRDPRQAR